MKKAKKKEKGHKIYITEVKARRYGEARVRGEAAVKLRVLFEDGSEEVRFWDGQKRWEKFIFERPAKAVSAEIDPDFIWLIDSNIANNSMKIKPCRRGIFRAAAKVMFWIQCGLSSLWGLS